MNESYLPDTVRQEYEAAYDLMDEGRYKEVQRRCRRILDHYDDSRNGLVRGLLADSFFYQEKYKEAARIDEELVSEFPENMEYRSVLAECWLRLCKYSKAKRIYESIDHVTSAFQNYAWGYCELLEKTGSKEKCADVLEKTLDDWKKQHFDENSPDASFPYFAYPRLLGYLIEEEEKEAADKALNELTAFIEHESNPSRYENELAYEISQLSDIANKYEWSRDLFRKLLDYLSQKDIFHFQSSIISSGYSSIESFEFYEQSSDDGFPYNMIYDIVSQSSDIEAESVENALLRKAQVNADLLPFRWLFARTASDYEKEVDEVENKYPHFAGRSVKVLTNGSRDWKGLMEKSLRQECLLTGKNQTELEKVYEKEYQDFKKKEETAVLKS